MTLHTIIHTVTWPEVSEALTRIYGDFAPLSVCEKAFNGRMSVLFRVMIAISRIPVVTYSPLTE